MSTARVPSGVPTGGQYAPTPRPEVDLRLVTTPAPRTPVWADLGEQWPNEHQRLAAFSEATYGYVVHPDTDPRDQVAAVRDLVSKHFDVRGRFVTLPEDDGAAASLVFDALQEDAKVSAAIERVVPLNDFETPAFASRLAGVLYDIEDLDREQRLVSHAIANDPYRGLRPAVDVEPPEPEYA